MSPFRRRKERRRILDVHFRPLHEPRKLALGLGQFVSRLWGSEEILDLRENFWRQPEFRMIVVFLAIGILLFSFQKIFTRAEVADFFPSNCLGTWQNPQNAQGEPQTFLIDVTAKILSTSNSAVYAGGDSQIFCGGFIPGEYETSGTIKQVGITLALQIGDKKEIAPAAIDVQAVTSTHAEVQGKPTSTSDIFQSSSTKPIEAPRSPEAPQPKNQSSSVSFWNGLKENVFALAFAQEESFPVQTAPIPEPAPPSPAAELPPMPPPEPAPPPPADTPPGMSPPAQEPTSTATEVSAPPIFLELQPLATSTEASGTIDIGTGTGTFPLEPVTVATPPPPPDEHFLKVSYSVDGELWVEAGKIDPVNWPNFTFILPVASWDDLKKLQVRLEGIPTTLPGPPPPVYLDGMLLEVRYEAAISPGAVATSTTPSVIDGEPKKLVTFDARATHTCKIEPFSQTLERGNSRSYKVKLKPSRPLASFELVTGDIPPGITAVFDQSKGWAAAEQTLTVGAVSTAQTGSFNLIVVYREQGEDGELLSSFCQLNLVVE